MMSLVVETGNVFMSLCLLFLCFSDSLSVELIPIPATRAFIIPLYGILSIKGNVSEITNNPPMVRVSAVKIILCLILNAYRIVFFYLPHMNFSRDL